MTDRKNPKSPVTIDSGMVFSGLFKGLGNFMEEISQALDEGGTEINRTGEFSLDKTNRTHGMYGISVKVNQLGMPSVERFGTVPGSDVREPVVDLFDEEKVIRIIAEMPGIEEQDVTTEVKETTLDLKAEREDRKYATKISLPAPVKEPAAITCRTGLVEIELEKV